MSGSTDFTDEPVIPPANSMPVVDTSVHPVVQAVIEFLSVPSNYYRVDEASHKSNWEIWLQIELCLHLSKSWERGAYIWDPESRHKDPISLWGKAQSGDVGIELHVPLFPLQKMGVSLRWDIEECLRSLPFTFSDNGRDRRPQDLGDTAYNWLKFAYRKPRTKLYCIAMTQHLGQLMAYWIQFSSQLSPAKVCWTRVDMDEPSTGKKPGAQWFMVWWVHEFGDESRLARLMC